MTDTLNNIMSSDEAAKLWGPKDLCLKSEEAIKEGRTQDVTVKCKKIGNVWVIDKSTPNPAAKKGGK